MESYRASFREFLDVWEQKLETLDADVEANDVDVTINGQTWPARNLFFGSVRTMIHFPTNIANSLT